MPTTLTTTDLVSAPTIPVLAVVNGHASGIRDPQRTRVAVRDALAAAGAAPEVVVTRSLHELRAALDRADERRMVLVGGDGALHAMANLGQRLPELALIPAGRANNIARALGIPTDLDAAAALAVTGTARPLDVLEVRIPGRTLRAVEGVSAGFQAAARAGYDAENSGALAAGAATLLRTLWAMPHFIARVSLDGGPVRPIPFEQLFLSTLPYFAFGLRVDPQADVRDGIGEAVELHASTRRRALSLLLSARDGRHVGRDGVEITPWRRATIHDAVPLAADGEPLGSTTADVVVLPGALQVVGALEG
jgi:diacylglycerol kinase family enzyme